MVKISSKKLFFKIQLFIRFLLYLQLFTLLLSPMFFTTKNSLCTGKYFFDDNYTLAVSSCIYSSPTAITTSTPAGDQIYIFTNLDTCRMYVYSNNKLQEYLFVSGGQPTAQTPIGTFPLDIGGTSFYFSTPDRKFQLCSTSCTPYSGIPTGFKNFSDGDLLLSPHDFEKLKRALANCAEQPIISIYCTTYPWHPLSIGMRNQDVLNVQKILYETSHYTGEINGLFDEKTKQSVIAFQKKHGLFATGIVNAATYSALCNISYVEKSYSLIYNNVK